MKRGLRWIWNGLAAFSLLLCLAAGGLWVRSYFAGDGWMGSDGVRVPTAGYSLAWREELWSWQGKIRFVIDRRFGAVGPMSGLVPSPMVATSEMLFARAGPSRRFLGFEYLENWGYPALANVRIGPPVLLTRMWTVPDWAVAIAFAAAPAVWAIRRRRQEKGIRQGFCPTCGYDLRRDARSVPRVRCIGSNKGKMIRWCYRWILSGLTLLSLALCVAACVIWYMGCGQAFDQWRLETDSYTVPRESHRYWELTSGRGRVFLQMHTYYIARPPLDERSKMDEAAQSSPGNPRLFHDAIPPWGLHYARSPGHPELDPQIYSLGGVEYTWKDTVTQGWHA